MQSIENKDAPEIPGEGKPRRNACSPDKLLDFPPEATTLYENFLLGVKVSGDSKFLGHRPIINGVAQPYVWETYSEIQQRVANFGSGLCNLGLKTKEFLGFFSINTPEYVIADLACNQYNFISVTLYDTLGAEALKLIINQTGLEFVFTTSNKGRTLLDMKESLPTLKTIIISDDVDQDFIKRANELKVQLVDFMTVENDGKSHKTEEVNPKPNDIATICYTSGTTGMPKGVVLTHKNLMATICSTIFLGEKGKLIKFKKDDVHISYLPLSHVYEKVIEITFIYAGAAIGFYQGDTLKLLDDIAELKPTVFFSVPRLLNRIYDKLFASVKEKSRVAHWMFTTAYNAKKIGLSKGKIDHWLWDKLVFSSVRERLGGRVRTIVSGAAPISPDVMDFLKICFSANVFEAYGQTESAGALSVVRHSVFKEYYKEPQKTKEVLDKDGWCHTGDIGMWDELGRLVIVDRIKNIFKLAQGEYIAPEKIETVYCKHNLVAQAFVYGESLQESLVGIIVPDCDALILWAKQNNLEKHTFEELCKLPEIKKHILQTLVNHGKINDLKGFENVKNICLISESFSVENDLLTPTFKLKRHQARIKFQKEIETLYSEISQA
ncbi:3668_t:CDS:2 [Racocetra fulgida]|uniref:3668_t:CDS:1 n=1 Tax=Racocetra fulgida TaxID=60492 RepID=A0A9N8ZQH0_9GLOM|nr:3668_t:CDS:2 [Racocetra fulgida]